MLSFAKENHRTLFLRQDYRLIPTLVGEIRRADKEKVLRVALSTLMNLCEVDEAVELMVENRLINEIDVISRRVIKDPDVADLVRSMGDLLQKSMKILSTYEKYLKELNRGDLVPGVTHSEKFWKENFRQFESNKFENVQ
jgi:V-type H+-transporting ATPase subunit H